MEVRVVKQGEGKVSLLITSQGTPPLPAVALRDVEGAEVAKRVASELAEFKRARVLPVPGGTT